MAVQILHCGRAACLLLELLAVNGSISLQMVSRVALKLLAESIDQSISMGIKQKAEMFLESKKGHYAVALRRKR